MNLTVVIVNWNGGDLLLRCLQSIRASRTSFAVSVIVVDNNSSDGSRERAQSQFPEFRIFNSGANLGFGRANNLARTMVVTPLVLFLNPDTELKVNTLERMVKLIESHPDIGASGCLMRYPDGTVQEQGLQWYPTPLTVFLELLLANRLCRRLFQRWLPRFDPLHSTYVRKLYGGFVLARKQALDQAGWFDDRYFMYAEDVDLSRTFISLGWKLYYFSEAEIVHVSGGISEKAPSGFAILMKNDSIAKYMRKYYGWGGGAAYRVAIFLAGVTRLAALVPAQILSWCNQPKLAADHWQGSLLKQKLMVLWALGLKKPFIANSAASAD